MGLENTNYVGHLSKKQRVLKTIEDLPEDILIPNDSNISIREPEETICIYPLKPIESITIPQEASKIGYTGSPDYTLNFTFKDQSYAIQIR